MLKVFFICFFVGLFILVGLFGAYFVYQDKLSAPSDDKTKHQFTISKGERISEIALKLKNEGYIKDDFSFKIYLKLNGLESRLQSGEFSISKSMNASEIVEELSHGTSDKRVTLLEGWRVEEMALVLSKELGIGEQDFIKKSKEGYMFPDTYQFPKETDADEVIGILKDNFDVKYVKAVKESKSKTKYSQNEIVTIASIIERESKGGEERNIISGILQKRLAEGMALEVDATVQYAIGYDEIQNTWWKKGLTTDDLKIDSPYNSRKVAGLPPNPICNPSYESLSAALNPKESPYWFYSHDKKGVVHYAKTIDEHLQNISKYGVQ